MMTIFELLFVALLIILAIQLCKKRCASRPSSTSNPATYSRPDLERFRRENQRNGGQASYQHSVNVANPDERKELVRKNLFSKTISGEKSVLNLAHLLAISRGAEGAMMDEEVGICNSTGDGVPRIDADTKSNSVEIEPSMTHDDLTLDATISEMSVLPEPTAPPLHSKDMVVAEGNSELSPETQPDATPQANEATQGSLRNLFSNLTQNIRRLSLQQTTEEKHIECCICLDNFNPNDIIAWAKDGGDATPISSEGTDTGCDHIFHQGKV